MGRVTLNPGSVDVRTLSRSDVTGTHTVFTSVNGDGLREGGVGAVNQREKGEGSLSGFPVFLRVSTPSGRGGATPYRTPGEGAERGPLLGPDPFGS